MWEKSFRESFASVNDVLSIIADGETSAETGRGAPSRSGTSERGPRLQQQTDGDSSSWFPRPSSPSSRKRVTAWGTPDSSVADVTPSTTYASVRGRQSGPGATSPEEVPYRRRQQEAAGSSGGVPSTTTFASSRGTAAGGTDWSGGSRTSIGGAAAAGAVREGAVTGVRGGFVGSSSEIPAEVSGMLQRYSEMMLRVVQVTLRNMLFFLCTFVRVCVPAQPEYTQAPSSLGTAPHPQH